MVGFAAAGVASLMHSTAQHADHHWALEPIFDANPSIRDEAAASGSHDIPPMIPRRNAWKARAADLLHIDTETCLKLLPMVDVTTLVQVILGGRKFAVALRSG